MIKRGKIIINRWSKGNNIKQFDYIKQQWSCLSNRWSKEVKEQLKM